MKDTFLIKIIGSDITHIYSFSTLKYFALAYDQNALMIRIPLKISWWSALRILFAWSILIKRMTEFLVFLSRFQTFSISWIKILTQITRNSEPKLGVHLQKRNLRWPLWRSPWLKLIFSTIFFTLEIHVKIAFWRWQTNLFQRFSGGIWTGYPYRQFTFHFLIQFIACLNLSVFHFCLHKTIRSFLLSCHIMRFSIISFLLFCI